MTSISKLLLVPLISVFSISATAEVAIHNLASGAEVDSPFPLSATAITCSSQKVAVVGYSLDSSPDSTFFEGTLLDASVTSSAGAHTLHVKAWGAQGAFCVTDIAITVKPGVSGASNKLFIPPSARVVHNLQTFGDWKAIPDRGVGGRARGAMALVNSPSIHGASRKFFTSYRAAGGERYSINFGDDTRATNFFYDAFVYLTPSTSTVANLEMDMNQVMPNGWTVTFGIQCDGNSGTWDYTFNAGSPLHWVDRWAHSKSRCNVQSWKKQVWHHVQAYYSRDSEGRVTYHAVWLDGVENPIEATVPSAFALHWGDFLISNFQVDGRGAAGSNVVYLDDLSITRW